MAMIWPHDRSASPFSLTRPKGFEPLTFGSVDRAACLRNGLVGRRYAGISGGFRGRLRAGLWLLAGVSRRFGRDLATGVGR